MANFKRGKMKTKTYDGKGFNTTKDLDAIAASKSKGLLTKKKRVTKKFGIEVGTRYVGTNGNPHFGRLTKVKRWYATETQRDDAIRTFENNSSAMFCAFKDMKTVRTITKISRA